ncbi:MAG TPA: DUF6776 family protein [Steroidobacteraceae bacterium]|jgi:hypothetical protein|nr:DUF6776 family protein [Steroidobacteraceae bacterium]
MQIPGKLVVRTYAPARRWIVVSILVLLSGLALYVMFELGRYKAGYDALQAAAQRDGLQQQIAKLERAQRELHVQLAAAEQARLAGGQERAEVARTIGELQAQVARDQQEMGFYRGLMAQPGQPAADAVRVQQFRISTMPGEQHYSLRFSLSRTQRPEEAVNGTIAITVDGTREGAPASADLAALTGGKSELPFNFRYFAAIEQPVTLPGDFRPDHVTIEVRPGRKGVATYRQTFVWYADPSS